MPKIHFIGGPLELYRYRTFLDVLIDNKKTWGVSLDYNSLDSIQRKRNIIVGKLSSLFRLLRNIGYIVMADYVYCPPMVMGKDNSSRFLIWICNVLRKKVIFDFYISLYDTLVLDRQTVTSDSKDAHRLTELDRWGHTRYRSIYLNSCEARRYRGLNQLLCNEKTIIIPLSISARPFAQLNYFKVNKKTSFNMVWWGTYIPLHGLDKIIEAVEIVSAKGFDIHLYIMGNNPSLSKKYKERVSGVRDLSSVISISDDLTFSNGKLLPFLIEKCDLAFGAFGDSEKAKTVILNKAIEAVAMKIPVLTQYSEAFQEFFDPTTTLFYCKNEAGKIADKIIEIMSFNYDTIEERLNNSYKIYEEHFSIEASKRKFKDLLRSLE